MKGRRFVRPDSDALGTAAADQEKAQVEQIRYSWGESKMRPKQSRREQQNN